MFRLNDALKAIRARRWTILACLFAGLAIAGVLSVTAQRTYESSTELFFTVDGATDAPSAYQGSLLTLERMDSYARLATTTQLAQQVVDDTSVSLSAEEVARTVTAIPFPDTAILELTVTGTSAEQAQAIAASYGRLLPARVVELESGGDAAAPTVLVTTIQDATFEPTAVSPSVPRYLAIGAGAGLLLGLALALTRAQLDRRVDKHEEARHLVGAPFATRLYESKDLAKPPIGQLLNRPSPAARTFRALRFALSGSTNAGPAKVVVVTSPAPAEGKSTVAVGLAMSLARSGGRVLLVEGNLWRPRVTRYLGMAASDRGLTDVLGGAADVREVTLPSNDGRLSVLAAGPMPEDSGELLGSAEMRALLGILRDTYDHVIIDTPALLPLVDAAAVSALADGVLLVARYGTTHREDLQEAVTALTAVDARVLGLVVNRVPASAAPRAERKEYQADAGRKWVPRLGLRSRKPGTMDQHATDALPAASGHS